MINLRKMRVEEYPAYCDYFIADYSQEIAQNNGHSIEIATDLAHQNLIRRFPNGLETNEHDLMCIEIDSANSLKVIGYLWHSIKSSDVSTFIYDFYIADEYRGNGYGKKAISQLEKLLVSADINQIKLRVAYQNQQALALYQEIGFTISGYNMSKKLVG
ncbi:GNAT family N-acetyltransferase [Marinomonas pontica]|uniref:GNAT family N-acetyltransferase n=1 Tax=Marinomonas pontica TaxID=264739 RepID=UPI002242F199|nr:GNAT family N-acetyltransferase [Marinomonas pontica]MCW8357056.1 GNAT family N-acetyltransferase [Marinomonas pontica]